MSNAERGRDLRDLQGERLALLVRYDGHLPPQIYARIREIEIAIAWAKYVCKDRPIKH